MIRKKSTLKVIAWFAILLIAPLASEAKIFFFDNFTGGSTLTNLTPAAPTTNSTAYQLTSSKQITTTNTLSSGFLRHGIGSTTGGGMEVQALFTTNAVALVETNDFVRMTVTFTNNAGLVTSNCLLGFGLYNGGQVQPVPGGLINLALDSVTANANGGVQNWQGYWGQLSFTNTTSRIVNRFPQTGANNRNQNLTSTGSGSQSYGFPGGATVGTALQAASVALVPGSNYTVVLEIKLIGANILAITNTYYGGSGTNGPVVSRFGGVASGATYVTSSYDALGIGWRATANSVGGTVMDITSIMIDGVSTVVTAPPDIITQPIPVTVPPGATTAFSVVAQGFSMTYQWKRYGTNLVNGGNISGANTDTLVISPANAADVATGANGYFVTVSGSGGFSTNSTTNSLTLGVAKNLVWSGGGNVWDLNTTANWLDPVNPATFNYGDAVTFDNNGALNGAVTLTGKFLSASSVTVDTSPGFDYVWVTASSGSFAGPGQLIYKGGGLLTLNNVNTYSGGTIISNANAYLIVGNYAALGTGPITLAQAGGTMEVVPVGAATVGIAGDVIVQDDFTIQFDQVATTGAGAFAGVVFGNLSGTPGKTLTLNPKLMTTTNRFRFYGLNTTMDANIVVNGQSNPYPIADGTVFASYHPNGIQTYNGVISGNGGFIQRSGGITVLNGQNTFAGGAIPTTGTIGIGVDSTPTSGPVSSGPIGVGALMIAPEIPNATGSGTVLAFGGAHTIANPLQYPSATNNQTLIVGGTNALTFSGPVTLNAIDGTTFPFTNRTIQINNTAVTTISGEISGNGFGLVKTGTGVLDLTATETYTGPTAVNAGILRVNGSLNAASAVTVATNGALAGGGTINGPVTVALGGIIAPGNSIGTLTIANSLTLSGNLNVEVDRAGPASDQVSVSGILTNAGIGTVVVTNVGAALQTGDTFTLFNKALSNGNTMTITGGQVVWNNNLAVDGTISVAAPIATTPTNISFGVSGTNLTLSWPANYITWSLQSNRVSITSTDWFTIAGSAAATTFNIPVNQSRSNVFYRLIAP